MRKPPPAWHAHALELYLAGIDVAEVARLIGKSHHNVAWAVDHNDEREKTRNRVRLQRALAKRAA
jgi:hypothetical protein